MQPWRYRYYRKCWLVDYTERHFVLPSLLRPLTCEGRDSSPATKASPAFHRTSRAAAYFAVRFVAIVFRFAYITITYRLA